MMRKFNEKELKANLLNILIYFDELCRKNKLKYSLDGGTLLGAARHKGFIPWDDDIDVIMPLPDYKKFLALSEINDENNKYRIHTATTEQFYNENYHYPFAKLEDATTIANYLHNYDEGGAFIDIFPITGYPNDEQQREKLINELNVLHNKIGIIVHKFRNPIKIIRRYFYAANYKNYRDEMTQLAFNVDYESARVVGDLLWANDRENEYLSKKDFEQYAKLDFEGKKFQVIENYQKLLELEYGDWEKLPPKSQRVSHHWIEVYKK